MHGWPQYEGVVELWGRRLPALVMMLGIVASVGCGGRAAPNHGSAATGHAGLSTAVAPHVTSASGLANPVEASAAASPTGGPAVVVAAAESSGLAGATAPSGSRSRAVALAIEEPATVEELLEEGLHGAGASPVHLAIRGTPAADSTRCAWRGIARTAAQREDAIRFWFQLGATDAIPDVATLELLFTVTLDTLDPEYRETAKANFLAIARGGESMDYLFLTCFADYAVTNFLLGTGTTPTTVTVAYDRMDEAASYDLYVREHDTGTYGTDALQTRGDYEAGLQAQVVAAEKA